MKTLPKRTKRHDFSTDAKKAELEMDRLTGCAQPRTVAISLSQATQLLLDATESNRTWLNDFADDVIRIDSDLYEVLLAYQSLRGEAA